MKHLIFGDLHGNLPALEKLLQLEQGNFDGLVCHGDVVNYGPWSNECVLMLEEIPDCEKLKGNHEMAFISGEYPGTNKIARTFFEHCYPRFAEKEIIVKYEEEKKKGDFVVKHTINESYIYPDTDLSKVQLDKNYIIGHSHYQFDRSFNGRRLINTGSLGQNREYINVSNYIILDEEKNLVELKSFTFDLRLVVDKMEKENYPQLCIDYYRSKKVA